MVAIQVLPSWFQPALQGMTYWIGHRRQFYCGYPIGESAFVAEFCNLIQSNLRIPELRLRCEVKFSELLRCELGEDSVLTERARADLVVEKKLKDETTRPCHIIEVKRGQALNSAVKKDLMRLVEVKRHIPDSRAFLVLVSEKGRPKKYVNEKGNAIRGRHSLDGGYFMVRRACMATTSVSRSDTAHYACVMEVFSS